VRNVPKSRNAPSISLDRQSVQRLAAEALAGHRQVFSFHLQVGGWVGGGGGRAWLGAGCCGAGCGGAWMLRRAGRWAPGNLPSTIHHAA
jgi:hypothetical protein